jgi:broad specificity phosphatase PhoE
MNLSHWHRRLSCMALLAWACGAMPQVTAVGPECHQAEVRESLERLRAKLPEAVQMLREIDDAKYACRVVRKTTGVATTDTNGDHVMIGWPGEPGRRHVDDSCVDVDASLAHELYHCWVRARHAGEEPCAYELTRTASGVLVSARASCEFDAVRFENRYRKAVGICERLSYQNLLVPGAERTCTATQEVCRASTSCAGGVLAKTTSARNGNDWALLRQPGSIVLFRHAEAPGVGDPQHFKLGDCSTQRNLNEAGRQQARRLGESFRAQGLRVAAVWSSQWCRSRDTATLAFPNERVEEQPVFNSLFGRGEEGAAQTAAARALLQRWPVQTSGVLLVFSHQANISALTGEPTASGEGIVLRRDGQALRVLGRVQP